MDTDSVKPIILVARVHLHQRGRVFVYLFFVVSGRGLVGASYFSEEGSAVPHYLWYPE